MGFFEIPSSAEAIGFVRKWGPIGMCTHYCISLGVLAIVYGVVYAKRDALLGELPLPDYVPRTGTDLMIAMALHKLTLPLRVPLTLFVVPRVHKCATRLGIVGMIEGFSRVFGSLCPSREEGPAQQDSDEKND